MVGDGWGYAASTSALLCVTVILVFRAGSVVEGEAFALSGHDILPRADLALSKIASVVPPHAGALMYTIVGPSPGLTQTATDRLAEVGLLTTDRGTTILSALSSPRTRRGSFRSCLIATHTFLCDAYRSSRINAVPSTYRVELRFARQSLVLYRREGA